MKLWMAGLGVVALSNANTHCGVHTHAHTRACITGNSLMHFAVLTMVIAALQLAVFRSLDVVTMADLELLGDGIDHSGSRYRIGMSMDDLPLTVFTSEDCGRP